MEKGDISNEFAPIIVVDLDLLLKKNKDTVGSRLKSLFGFDEYTLKSWRLVEYMEKLFMGEYTIYLLDRKYDDNRRETIVEDLPYNRFMGETDWIEIRRLARSKRVANIFFRDDFEIGQFDKAVFVEDFKEIFDRMRIYGGVR